MTVEFSEHFWGTRNNGFDVLYHNMKYGLTASKELSEFFRERSSLEEVHSKSLAKLAKIAANGSPNGSFGPFWQILKNSAEKLSMIHLQMMHKVQDLVKELTKYADDLQKRHKVVKEEESGTLEVVQLIQNSTNTVQKAKENYFQRAQELEKLQKENASQKEIEKAEVKTKKAQEEYRTGVEKYTTCRDDFEKKMVLACKRFQDVEISHLAQMKEFLETYASLVDANHNLIGQVHGEFRRQCSDLTIESLLEQLISSKATGQERPGSLEVEDAGNGDKASGFNLGSEDKSCNGDRGPTTEKKKSEGNSDLSIEEIRTSKGSRRTTSLLNLFIPLSQGNKGNSSSKGNDSPNLDLSTGFGQQQSPANNKSTLSRSANRGSKWFLRSRREKKKDKKKKKKDGNQSGKEDKSDAEDKDESRKSDTPTAEVDEEGYTVRPKTTSIWENDKSSFYSSSDSDSDDEREKRLHIEIKPLSNGTAPLSASVDELRSTVENMTLSPVGIVGRKLPYEVENQMKRSQSVSQQIGNSSPPSRHPYTPLSPPIPPPNPRSSPKLQSNDSASRYCDLGDLFAEVGEIQPTLPPKMGAAARNTPTPTAIPRPPSRPRPEPAWTQRNTSSPSPAMSRTESIGSLDNRSVSSQIVGSRGPSPLTIGMTDSIPLAVAFHEIVHACFKGNDETLCQVKISGDMMVSFPAGIIQVFTSNPTPAQLAFRVSSPQILENLTSNNDLVDVKRNGDELVFEFYMSALIALLKKHAEQHPSASYFNVDILKYQMRPKSGVSSCPLHLVAFWKCEKSQTDLRIDYKYNSHAMATARSEVPNLLTKVEPTLVGVCIAAPVDGGVKTMQSKPTGQWFPNTNRACWKLPTLSASSDNQGVGSLRARFEVTTGPSSQGTIAAQFSCENSTLSGCEFELMGSGYRVSLIKKRFVSGKYTCDTIDTSRYAVPADIVTQV